MSVCLYYGSGSPFAWRVWLALEHKGIPYHLKTLSFDSGDLKSPEFRALNPRRRAPVLVDGDFAHAESAAIVECIEDRWPSGPALFARDPLPFVQKTWPPQSLRLDVARGAPIVGSSQRIYRPRRLTGGRR